MTTIVSSTRRIRPASVLVLMASLYLPAVAGGPRSVNGQGQPMVWISGTTVSYHPETGSLGILTNAQARALVAQAFASWVGATGVNLVEGTPIPYDVNATGVPTTNAAHYKNFWRVDGDGLSPVLFDSDGKIIDALFGVGARFDVVGLAVLDTPVGLTTTITGASMVINGLFFDAVGMPSSPEDLPSQLALEAAMTHEVGHVLNLDHSLVNADLGRDAYAANDVYVPTMFPLTVADEEALATLNPDDIAAAQELYHVVPATTGITGVVTVNGVPFQGAEVVARKTDDPLMYAYGNVSGALFFPCNAGSTCDPCTTSCDPGNPPAQGAYALSFLAPGSYQVSLHALDTRISLANGTFVGPLATPPIVPGPEELYSAGETSASSDDPDDAATLAPGLLTGIDIQVNGLPTTDLNEPNEIPAEATMLPGLSGGTDTVFGLLGPGDRDQFAIPVTAGQRVRIDVEAAEGGSTLDSIAGLYDGSGNRIALVDDAVDPDSAVYGFDPAIDVVAGFTGTARLVLTSYPDTNQTGSGGLSSGGYWLRVRVETDTDSDGIPDALDGCVGQQGAGTDGDGLCVDNCPAVANANQQDTDTDGVGNACDNCPSLSNPTQADLDGDAIGDVCDQDEDNDGVIFGSDNCPTVYNPGQEDTIDPIPGGPGDACIYLQCYTTDPAYDADLDGVMDTCDNCNRIPNHDQADADADGRGDVCDPDILVSRVMLTDDGDNDGYADTNETVTMKLVLYNRSTLARTDVTARLATGSSNISCMSKSTLDVGTIPTLGEVTTTAGFVFHVANVNRTSIGQALSVDFTLTVDSNETAPITVPWPITIDLDFDVTLGGPPIQFFDGFEGAATLGTFTAENLDSGLTANNAAANGYRCRNNDPDNPNSISWGNTNCHPPISSSSFNWARDTVRAYAGTRSLHYGLLFNGTDNTTPVGALEGVRSTANIALGWNATYPVLRFKHQASLVDSRCINLGSAVDAVDRAVVMVRVFNNVGLPQSDWMKLYPSRNAYHATASDEFSNCSFDPIDDGSTEDSAYDAYLGPSSTCVDTSVFSYVGDTRFPYSASNLGRAEGPGLQGAVGDGTWVESQFDLSRFRGRLIRLRFLAASTEVGSVSRWRDFFGNPTACDDGWWIDDVTVDGVLGTAASAPIDVKANTALPGMADSDGDGVQNSCDNCPSVVNAGQADFDHDDIGDACTGGPQVILALPPDGATDVALATSVALVFDRAIDPASATADAVIVRAGGVKVEGRVAATDDHLTVGFDPDGVLATGTTYTIEVNSRLLSASHGAAPAFVSSFTTTVQPASGTVPASDIGTQGGVGDLSGQNADDLSGFAAAVLEDVNDDGVADILVGAPNADVASLADAGSIRLVFGRSGLQAGSAVLSVLDYRGDAANGHAGKAVSPAGDMNGDGIADFLIGAPEADANGTDSGAAWLVFGNAGLDELAGTSRELSALAACAEPTSCGTKFLGEQAGDLAGLALAPAGDLNHDGNDDIVIGAPGASPGGRLAAGKAYLIYGPLSAGTIDLASVGTTTPGLVFFGEFAGDRLGTSVSPSPKESGNGIDDLLLGAPGASVAADDGSPMLEAGCLYAIHGGTANLDDSATPGRIELSRVAGGGTNQVAGTVFVGATPGHHIGRAVTGKIDFNGDGTPDILVGAHHEVWLIPGLGPKTTSGSTTLKPGDQPASTLRDGGGPDAVSQFGATRFTEGSEGDLGDLNVAEAGDVNNDGFEDFVIGAPDADPAGGADAGKIYIVFGGAVPPGPEVELASIGTTTAGLVVTGAEAGDQLGAAVSGGADVNADGVSDVLAGAPFADTAPTTPTDAGDTYVISPIVPEEVVLLRVAPSGPTRTAVLEWSVPPLAVSYNVYRGLLSTVRSGGGVRTATMTQLACHLVHDADVDGLPDTTDPDTPSAGESFLYLVTGNNLLGEGPLGGAAATRLRLNDDPCP